MLGADIDDRCAQSGGRSRKVFRWRRAEQPFMVGGMAFWEAQLLELLRGIDALLADAVSAAPDEALGRGGLSGAGAPRLLTGMAIPDWRGSGAGAAAAMSADLAAVHARRAAADERVAAALEGAHAAAQTACARLRALRAELEEGVAARRPTLDAVGAQMEMAQFLHGKAGELLAVIRQAQHESMGRGSALSAATTTYRV